MLMMCFLSVII